MNKTAFDAETFIPEAGISLIEASAGTGKTYCITRLVCRWIEEGRCRIEEALVLTFTEAATAELKHRIRQGLEASLDSHRKHDRLQSPEARRLQEAIDTFEFAAIFTLHGFCNRLCREYPFDAELGSEFAISTDDRAFWESVQLEAVRWMHAEGNRHPLFLPACQYLGSDAEWIAQTMKLKQSSGFESSGSFDWEAWNAVAEAFRKSWQREGSAWIELAHSQDDPIKRQKACYKPEGLEQIHRRFSRWIEQGEVHPKFFEDLISLSSAEIEGRLKKGKSLPDLDLIRCADAWRDQLEALPAYLAHEFLKMRDRAVEHAIRREQTLRFDDLLQCALKLTESGSARAINHRYQVCLVDEFQDTDPLQFQILDRLFLAQKTGGKDRPLILIGDPKQAIYSFRGGDIFTYRMAVNQAQKVYYLDTNWRSSPYVNRGVNALLQSNSRPFEFEWIDYEAVQTAERNHQAGRSFVLLTAAAARVAGGNQLA